VVEELMVNAFTALQEVAEYLAGQTLSVDVETVNYLLCTSKVLDRFREFLPL